MEFQAPGLAIVQPCSLWAFGKWDSQWEISLLHSLSLLLSNKTSSFWEVSCSFKQSYCEKFLYLQKKMYKSIYTGKEINTSYTECQSITNLGFSGLEKKKHLIRSYGKLFWSLEVWIVFKMEWWFNLLKIGNLSLSYKIYFIYLKGRMTAGTGERQQGSETSDCWCMPQMAEMPGTGTWRSIRNSCRGVGPRHLRVIFCYFPRSQDLKQLSHMGRQLCKSLRDWQVKT